MDKREFSFTLILIVFGIASFAYSMSLPAMGAIALSPGLFPGSVSVLLTLLSTLHALKLWRNRQATERAEEEEKRSFIIIMLIFIGYLVLLSLIHFIASTIIFLVVTMLFLYRKFLWKIPVISVVAVVGIYYLFRYLLNVRLP